MAEERQHPTTPSPKPQQPYLNPYSHKPEALSPKTASVVLPLVHRSPNRLNYDFGCCADCLVVFLEEHDVGAYILRRRLKG